MWSTLCVYVVGLHPRVVRERGEEEEEEEVREDSDEKYKRKREREDDDKTQSTHTRDQCKLGENFLSKKSFF